MKKERAYRKLDKKIYYVIFLVIAIAIINAVFSTFVIRKSHNITSDIVENANPSLESLAQMNLMVTQSRMLITNWVYLPENKTDKIKLVSLNEHKFIALKKRIQNLMPNWEHHENIVKMNTVFNDYQKLIAFENKITNTLVAFDDYQDPMKKFAAEDILEREIIPQSEKIISELREIIQVQTASSMDKQDQMLYSFKTLLIAVLGIAMLIICSILFAAFIVSRSIIVPILSIRELIKQMSNGELPELRMKTPNNAVGEMFGALKALIESFKRTSQFADEIGKGNFTHPFKPLSTKDVQGHALLTMRNRLKSAAETESQRTWVAEGLAQLNLIMRTSNDDFNILLDKIIGMIVQYVNVQQAAIFLLHNDDLNDLHIQLGAYYALNNKILNSKRYELKEGLIGEAIAANKIISLNRVNDPYFNIESGLGNSKECSLMIIPLATSGKVVGAIEVAAVNALSPMQKELLEKIAEPIAASLFSVRANLITTQLLDESRKQAEELAYQEQELRKINDELTFKSEQLQKSEEVLRAQQDKMQMVNIQLEEKAKLLEERNLAIEDARQSLSFKAEQLEQSNKYKSAFLANMSHELRTPLNSILILAKLLSDNKVKTLEPKQVEHARIIYKSGSDLLTLINDILDLSKIEAGKVELVLEQFPTLQIADDMQMLFAELANERQINFIISADEVKHSVLYADKVRIEQVVKNLLSNAFKFTPAHGTVELKLSYAEKETIFKNKTLLQTDKVICISVRDTGIGISEDKQKLVFEAFQQADGSTSRKYGGTGLGLAISRELTAMLGGELSLESAEGTGSTFTIYIAENTLKNATPAIETGEIEITDHGTSALPPQAMPGINDTNQHEKNMAEYQLEEINDDRNNITHGDKIILIIEDDFIFARALLNHCHRYNFKSIIALQGELGLQYASEYSPDAIILDMRMPVMDGWTVLKKLKSNKQLENIPVHVISSMDKNNMTLEMGAFSYLKKPAGKEEMDQLFKIIGKNIHAPEHRLLLLNDSKAEMSKIISLLHEKQKDIHIDITENFDAFIHQAKHAHYDCVLLSKGEAPALPEENIQLLKSDESLANIPTLFYANNPDECLREVSLLLTQQTEKQTKQEGKLFLNNGAHKNNITDKMNTLLQGKTVLLADDDMRNIYSMTNVLESEGLKVICAMDGQEAVNRLNEHPEIDIVLMDIMMPNMNGYEAIAEIRKDKRFYNLPIIAVTAKAMAGDRDKCMEAGATDYITKPVNTEQLISLMRVLFYK